MTDDDTTQEILARLIDNIRRAKGYKRGDLAAAIREDYNESHLSRFFNGKGGLTLSQQHRIAMFLGYPLSELLAIAESGRDELPNETTAASDNIAAYANAIAHQFSERIPLLAWDHGGMSSAEVRAIQQGSIRRWLPLKPERPGIYALEVLGDSMTAPYGQSFPAGAMIVVDPELRNPPSGKPIIARLRASGKLTFKSFIEDAGRRMLKSLNPQYPPILEEFDIVGTVVFIVQEC